jgi:carbamate kinase
MIQQSLRNALDRAGVQRPVVTLVTQVLVDRDDPATFTPRKPVGNTLELEQARALATELGWDIAPAEKGWRRIVPSPIPYGVVESAQIARLVADGTIVIACGGGGTPVYVDERLGFEGVDAVIDKDRAACILARDLGAEALLILTNVDAAYRAWGTPDQQRLERIRASEARSLLAAGEFGQGSMGPKIEAALDFVAAGGARAIIARLDRGLEAVQGRTGTTIVPD